MARGILLELLFVCGRVLPRPLRRRLIDWLPPYRRLRLARQLMRWPAPITWRPPWPAAWWPGGRAEPLGRAPEVIGGRRVREHGRWVVAEVADDASPQALRQRNLDAVLDVVAGAAVPYFCLPSADTRTVVGVRTPRPEELLRLLADAPELAAARVEPVHAPWGGLIAVRVYHAVTDPAGELTLGREYACEVEFWRRQGEQLTGPRPNPSGTTLPADDPTVVAPAWVLSEHVPVSADAPRVRTRAALARIPIDRVTFAIDAVYTWVDGDDPRWRDRMTAARDAHQGLRPEAIDPVRFTDRGELRYSLRSLAAMAPWLRRIYLVTDDQVPDWLDADHPRVTVVRHREIFGEVGRLPTFNSHAIESRLHRVPGLAEHFIYLHDDMFLGRPLGPTAFFHANGVAKFFPSATCFGLGPASAAATLADAAGRNDAEVIAQRFGRTVSRGAAPAPFPCQRSVLEEIETAAVARMEATAAHRFRDPADLAVLSSLQHHWAFMQARAVPGQIVRLYADTSRPSAALALARLARRRDVDVFCLDHTTRRGAPAGTEHHAAEQAEQRALVHDFLASYFPFRAPWELPLPDRRPTRAAIAAAPAPEATAELDLDPDGPVSAAADNALAEAARD
jgi:hypothetical protein